jgi:hypothetical protein
MGEFQIMRFGRPPPTVTHFDVERVITAGICNNLQRDFPRRTNALTGGPG